MTTLPRRIVSMDIVRGIAILWVMAFHLHLDMTLKILRVGEAGLYTALGNRLAERDSSRQCKRLVQRQGPAAAAR